ncbi:hypothetical protein EW026_g166 [Hermanssonia centrifuga]|uniref:Uncharacterized protein n=1 Tax=Hermanssonia centrifuga TaxID=98765 RepID=A0A4S4KWI6_9APHY|nr:hypothetical protein EW026_g166 [Hermanssonia centrifuga]
MFFKYAPEACSVYPTFACAFIIKLLQPRYSAFITSALRIEICDKVKQIIELFECEEIAIDEHHWPKLYANFLRGLLPDPTAGGLESDL